MLSGPDGTYLKGSNVFMYNVLRIFFPFGYQISITHYK